MRGDEIEDYAIFDDILVVKYRPNYQANHGILFLLWGKNRIGEYLRAPELIDKCFDPTLNVPLQQTEGMYKSFIELLDACPLLTIDITSSPFAATLNLSGHASLAKIYREIINQVNAGKLTFKQHYVDVFPKL